MAKVVAITADRSLGMSALSDRLRRSFQRELGRRPTLLQRELRDRAADWTAKANLARLDPTMSANDLVRLDGAASRARAEWYASFGRDQRQQTDTTLGDILKGVANA
jgi:hypothetical protein